jgi:hypothetical protein
VYRRRDILAKLGIEFEVVESKFQEDLDKSLFVTAVSTAQRMHACTLVACRTQRPWVACVHPRDILAEGFKRGRAMERCIQAHFDHLCGHYREREWKDSGEARGQ